MDRFISQESVVLVEDHAFQSSFSGLFCSSLVYKGEQNAFLFLISDGFFILLIQSYIFSFV